MNENNPMDNQPQIKEKVKEGADKGRRVISGHVKKIIAKKGLVAFKKGLALLIKSAGLLFSKGMLIAGAVILVFLLASMIISELEFEMPSAQGDKSSNEVENENTLEKTTVGDVTFDRVAETKGVQAEINKFYNNLTARGYWVVDPSDTDIKISKNKDEEILPNLMKPDEAEEKGIVDHYEREGLFSLTGELLFSLDRTFWDNAFVYPEHFLQSVPFTIIYDKEKTNDYSIRLADVVDRNYDVIKSRDYSPKERMFQDEKVSGTWDYGMATIYKYRQMNLDRYIKGTFTKEERWNKETYEIDVVDIEPFEHEVPADDSPGAVWVLDNVVSFLGNYEFDYIEEEEEMVEELETGEGDVGSNATKVPYKIVTVKVPITKASEFETLSEEEEELLGKFKGEKDAKEPKVKRKITLHRHREGGIYERGARPKYNEPMSVIEKEYREAFGIEKEHDFERDDLDDDDDDIEDVDDEETDDDEESEDEESEDKEEKEDKKKDKKEDKKKETSFLQKVDNFVFTPVYAKEEKEEKEKKEEKEEKKDDKKKEKEDKKDKKDKEEKEEDEVVEEELSLVEQIKKATSETIEKSLEVYDYMTGNHHDKKKTEEEEMKIIKKEIASIKASVGSSEMPDSFHAKQIEDLEDLRREMFLDGYGKYFQAWIPKEVEHFNYEARAGAMGVGADFDFSALDLKMQIELGSQLETASFKNSLKWLPTIKKYADEFGVNPYLILAQVAQESGGNPNHGGGGLTQILYMTELKATDVNGNVQRWTISDRYDPDQNIKYATMRHAQDIEMFGNGDPIKAFATHNFNPSYFFKANGLEDVWENKDGSYEFLNYMEEARSWTATHLGGQPNSVAPNLSCFGGATQQTLGNAWGDSCYVANVLRYYDSASAKSEGYNVIEDYTFVGKNKKGKKKASRTVQIETGTKAMVSEGRKTKPNAKKKDDEETLKIPGIQKGELDRDAYNSYWGLTDDDTDSADAGGSERVLKVTEGGYIIGQDVTGDMTVIKGIPLVNPLFPIKKEVSMSDKLVKTARSKADKMMKDAKKDGISLSILGEPSSKGHRTIAYQKSLFDGYVKQHGEKHADKYSARPHYSEHHLGTAMDFNSIETSFENTKEFKWLQENADKYGFILRFPKGSEHITKINYEPWHWRYVGEDVAKEIKEADITLEEYLGVDSLMTADEHDPDAVGIPVESGKMGQENVTRGLLGKLFGIGSKLENVEEEFVRVQFNRSVTIEDMRFLLLYSESHKQKLPLSMTDYDLTTILEKGEEEDGEEETGGSADGSYVGEIGYNGAGELTAKMKAEIMAGGVVRPSKQNNVSSPFSPWRVLGGQARPHAGTDIPLPEGTPLHAVQDGKIIAYQTKCPLNGFLNGGNGGCAANGPSIGFGNFVQIEIKGGYSVIYGHMSKVKAGIKEGTKVKKGELVGWSGGSGNSTGPHLHLELRLPSGQYVDPTFLITEAKAP